VNKIENEHIIFWIENGILFSEYKETFEMTLENSIEIYALRKEISNGQNQLFCYDISKLKSMTKEARDYGEIYGQNELTASSIIVNSHLTMFIYNAYLKLKNVKIPVKAFRTKEQAVEWLEHFKKNNN
jgi:hypothetical protein